MRGWVAMLSLLSQQRDSTRRCSAAASECERRRANARAHGNASVVRCVILEARKAQQRTRTRKRQPMQYTTQHHHANIVINADGRTWGARIRNTRGFPRTHLLKGVCVLGFAPVHPRIRPGQRRREASHVVGELKRVELRAKTRSRKQGVLATTGGQANNAARSHHGM